MKKILPLNIIMLLCLLVFGSVCQASTPPSVTVTGHSEIVLAPDTAHITLGVATTGTNLNETKKQNDETMQNIIQAIEQLGINKDYIQTSGLSLNPIYKQNKSDETVISGFRVNNNINLTLADLDLLGIVIDTAVNNGANQMYGLRFEINNPDAHRNDLIEKAVNDAKSKALVLAQATNGKLGTPLIINATSLRSPVLASFESTKLLKNSIKTPISQGLITLNMDINITYGLIY